MSEPTGPGMGRPSGPGFTGPPLTGQPLPGADPLAPYGSSTSTGPRGPSGATPDGPRPTPPPPSRLPTVLTVVAVALVAVVVGVATLLAGREDVRQAAPPPAPTMVSSTSLPAGDRIEFSTDTGSGVLQIVDHGWDSDGTDPDSPGSLLTVSIELTCESGILRYGPDSFQAFDRQGDLFEAAYVANSPTALELGTLSAGQHVSGTVAFDIPRGGVTLLLSDESSRTVTAIRVPD